MGTPPLCPPLRAIPFPPWQMGFANERADEFGTCLDVVRTFRRFQEWRILLIAADGAGRPVAPTEQTQRFLVERSEEVRVLDSARWAETLAEAEPNLPPLLLRVALRESVKLDTAPYRRHTVVLSPLEAVSEAKRRLSLQVQVCRPAALHDYLGWLQQAKASVDARG